MMGIGQILLVVAMICFLIAACNVSTPVNLVALGLFFLTLSQLLGSGVKL